VQHTAVLPIGGIHITNDLAIGLKTDLDIAEQVKLQHGGLAKHAKTGRVSVVVGKNKHDFDAEEIHMIIEARVEELLEYVDKELRKIQRSRKLPGGVVLVGGTSKLLGIDLFAKEKLELAARVGRLQPLAGLLDTVQDPSYSTAVGLMLLDMLLGVSSNPQANAQGAGVSELVGSLFKRFRK
jgi:cell division protein FtsA